MNTYENLGTAIYNIVNGVVLTGLTQTGTWPSGFNYEPKELTDFPLFTVVPQEDSETWLDSSTNQDEIRFVLRIYDRYEDSSATEARMRKIVDKVRDAIRKNLSLNNSVDFQVETKGRWLYETERGLRIYEQLIVGRKAETTL